MTTNINYIVNKLNKTLYFNLTDDRTVYGTFNLIDNDQNVILSNANEISNHSNLFKSDLDPNSNSNERWIGLVMIPKDMVRNVYEEA